MVGLPLSFLFFGRQFQILTDLVIHLIGQVDLIQGYVSSANIVSSSEDFLLNLDDCLEIHIKNLSERLKGQRFAWPFYIFFARKDGECSPR